MSIFLRILICFTVLILLSTLLLALFCFISNTENPTFADTISVFSLTAAVTGTILIIISIDDWKHQDNRRLERETALKLSEIINDRYVTFGNIIVRMVDIYIRKDFCNFFDYRIYDQIPPSRYKLIAEDIINLANSSHQQKLHSSRLIRFTKNQSIKPIYDELSKITDETYLSIKYIFDFKAENILFVHGEENSELYKKHYDGLKIQLLKLDNKKTHLDKLLDDIILIK